VLNVRNHFPKLFQEDGETYKIHFAVSKHDEKDQETPDEDGFLILSNYKLFFISGHAVEEAYLHEHHSIEVLQTNE